MENSTKLVERKFDVFFNDDNNSNNKGFEYSLEDCQNYIKWNNGERDINKEIVGWAGSCVFLVLVGTILTAFFG